MAKEGKHKLGLLPRILIAILLGIVLGYPLSLDPVRSFGTVIVRLSATFNSIFSNVLQFFIPLIIIGLVTPAIASVGKNAGKLLVITALIAYLDTVCSGFISYFTSASVFPHLIGGSGDLAEIGETTDPAAFFTINIPAMFDVMTSLVFSFTLGLGIAYFGSPKLSGAFDEFRAIVVKSIEVVIVPLLPFYVFGIFLSMTFTGQAVRVVSVFLSIIGVIFVMHVLLLVLQYCIAGAIAGRNPFKLLGTMLPAYFTALGTSSSAATIPVTLERTIKNGVSEGIAGFTVPLCATIHLSGSTLKIVACSVALMLMKGMPFTFGQFAGFIFMLGIMMVAAPGVPGGAIMAALGLLSSMLGFGPDEQALMIALYITMDSFGTACNVTGDGAIAIIIDKLFGKKAAQA